jgi:hypothetical protein
MAAFGEQKGANTADAHSEANTGVRPYWCRFRYQR